MVVDSVNFVFVDLLNMIDMIYSLLMDHAVVLDHQMLLPYPFYHCDVYIVDYILLCHHHDLYHLVLLHPFERSHPYRPYHPYHVDPLIGLNHYHFVVFGIIVSFLMLQFVVAFEFVIFFVLPLLAFFPQFLL